MQPLIKKQLERCQVADLSNYNKEKHQFIIPKYNQVRVVSGASYLFKLDKSLLTPNPDDVFHINWNRGLIPVSEYLFAEVDKINGKVIYVDGIGFNPETETTTSVAWSGWLPLDKVEVVKKG